MISQKLAEILRKNWNKIRSWIAIKNANEQKKLVEELGISYGELVILLSREKYNTKFITGCSEKFSFLFPV